MNLFTLIGTHLLAAALGASVVIGILAYWVFLDEVDELDAEITREARNERDLGRLLIPADFVLAELLSTPARDV